MIARRVRVLGQRLEPGEGPESCLLVWEWPGTGTMGTPMAFRQLVLPRLPTGAIPRSGCEATGLCLLTATPLLLKSLQFDKEQMAALTEANEVLKRQMEELQQEAAR